MLNHKIYGTKEPEFFLQKLKHKFILLLRSKVVAQIVDNILVPYVDESFAVLTFVKPKETTVLKLIMKKHQDGRKKNPTRICI